MTNLRSQPRRRVYLGEGLTFELRSRVSRLDAEAVDVSADGMGLVVSGGAVMLAIGEVVTLSRGDVHVSAVVRRVGRLRALPLIGVSFVEAGAAASAFPCSADLPAFAVAPSPWFHRETLRLRVAAVDAAGMTVSGGSLPLLPGMELDFALHLPCIGVVEARGRVAGDGVVAWCEPSRALLRDIAQYLLAGDASLTPAVLRAAGLCVGSVENAVAYDYATASDLDEVLALRLRAHQAIGHLEEACIDDMRSDFDGFSRHLVCRFGEQIIGYVRVIFVDGEPARSQYVSLGGHVVPAWLWAAGFCEAGAGAMDPAFQKAGLFVPLMAHSTRVAVQAGYRYVLGACDDDLLGMYQEMGYELLETREVEPKPGWRFRSHLIVMDVERVVSGAVAGKAVGDMAAAARFAGYVAPAALAVAA